MLGNIAYWHYRGYPNNTYNESSSLQLNSKTVKWHLSESLLENRITGSFKNLRNMRIVMSFEKPCYNMHQQHKLFAVSLIITIMAINIHNHPSKNTDMFT